MEQPAEPHHAGHRIEDPPEFEVTVGAVEAEAAGVVSLRLSRADGEPFPAWEPGAHVDLILSPELERQYSLCGDPASSDEWRVAVLREPESRGGSRFVHDEVAVGDRLRLRGPRNNFPLVAAERYLMIAGGIGITPLLPMIHELAAGEREWSLLYGGREERSMAFRGELAELGERVTLWPQDRRGLLPLADVVGEPLAGTAIYCCGPEALIEAVEATCEGWPKGTLHVERFSPRPGALEGAAEEFVVELARSGMTVQVAADETIAEAVEAAGVHVPTSCREGTCGTCETRVLSGTPDHRDSFLLDEEREDNETIMICCSRAKTGKLVLDL